MGQVFYLLPTNISDWGDYSDILISGMADRTQGHDGLLQLERTGPFVPPISFPGLGDVVITDTFRHLLEGSGLTGFTFRPVIKKHIVFLEWEKWGLTATEPEEYPESGEPEDYILSRPHSPEAATQTGDLWEVCLEEHAKHVPYQGLANWDGTDWFRAKGVLHIYVSERAKRWLEETASRWVTFAEAPTA